MKIISSLDEILSVYDTFIFDQWGVLHNGGELFPEAKRVLSFLHEKGKELFIASNSGKRSIKTFNKLVSNGIDFIDLNNIVTSGEEFYLLFDERYSYLNYYDDYMKLFQKANIFLINNDDDKDIFTNNINYNFVDNMENATVIIVKGIKSRTTNMNEYTDLLKTALNNNIPLICINSDLTTKELSGNLSICPGTLAQFYENNGGKVFWHGKPYNNIFNIIKQRATLNNKILMIGDNFHTDIQGAFNNSIDTLFTHKTGIHEYEDLNTLRKKYNLTPTFYMNHLR